MHRIDVDLRAMCLAAAGEGVANVSAHVSRSLLEAVRTVWPGGWRSGASPAVESIGAFRWALWCGCPWRGRTLMCAAARLGAIDVLRVVVPMYNYWDPQATVAAAKADQLEVIQEFDRAPRVAAGLLYAAGPRVRAHYADVRPLLFTAAPSPWYEPAHDFRRLLEGAVPIDALLSPWDGMTRQDVRERLGAEHPTVLVRARTHAPRLIGSTIQKKDLFIVLFIVDLPRQWSIIYDIRPTVGVIRFVDLGGQASRGVFEPARAWFVGGCRRSHIRMWIEAPSDTPSVDIEFTGAIASPVALEPYLKFAADDRIYYVAGMAGVVHGVHESRLARVDGSDDAALIV